MVPLIILGIVLACLVGSYLIGALMFDCYRFSHRR
jgi:hypothetical protein